MTVIVDLGQDVKELTPRMIALRRELHRHPELAFEEVWTAATLAEQMRALVFVVQDGIGGPGVLAVLEGARPGKTLLIRADMDAVPMEETPNREYVSTIKARNHRREFFARSRPHHVARRPRRVAVIRSRPTQEGTTATASPMVVAQGLPELRHRQL